MGELDFFIQKEKKLQALANSRFGSDLSPAEMKVLHDSVRPGVPDAPKGPRGENLSPKGRVVRPQLLRWLSVDTDVSSLIDVNGIWVMYATIDGHIDLAGCKTPFTLNFINCVLTETLGLKFSTFMGVVLQGCSVQKQIDASNITCQGAFYVTDTVLEGELYLHGATVTEVVISKSRLLQGMNASDIDCRGDFGVLECQCFGEMRFVNAQVAKNFILTGSHIAADKTNPELNLGGAIVGHDLSASCNGRAGFRCDRTIDAVDLEVGGNLDFGGAQLTFGGDALRLDVANIKGELFLQSWPDDTTGKPIPFTCNGSIHLPHTHIGQDIHGADAVFNCKGIAFEMTGAEVLAGAVFFNNLTCAGSISCQGARISDGLYLKGAKISQKGRVVKLDDAVIGKYLTLENFDSPGSVSMNGGTIDGTFVCKGAKLDSLTLANVRVSQDFIASGATFTSTGMSVNFVSTVVEGKLDLSNVTSLAYFSFLRSKIGERVTLAGTKIGVASDSYAVYMEGVGLGQGLEMHSGFETEGHVGVQNGSIGGNISLVGAKMHSLELVRVQVAGNLYWLGIKDPSKTGLTLKDSSLRALYDDNLSWPGPGLLKVTGLAYHSLELRKSPNSGQVKEVLIPDADVQTSDVRIKWLKLQNSKDVITSQPWLQLSGFYSGLGDDVGAKHVLYEMRRVQGYSRGSIERLIHIPNDIVEENPLKIAYPILALWAMGSVVFWRAHRMKAMAPTDSSAYDSFTQGRPTEGYVPFHPAIYALENVLPAVKLGHTAWAPNPEAVSSELRIGWRRWLPCIEYRWLARLRWTLIVLGWALALILAGAIAGRFKS